MSHLAELIGEIAAIMWNPFLSFLYLEIGVLFLILTKGVVFKQSYTILKKLWSSTTGDSGQTISHRKALLTSLATTVGVGNLAGVGTAIHLGGPGALFWMWVSAILGMSFRMMSTYMALKHNPTNTKSPLFGTPLNYLQLGFSKSLSWLAPVMGVAIIVKGVVASNMIQANSVAHAIHNELGVSTLLIATGLAIAVGMVVIGGMRTIVNVSSFLAPWMILIYSVAAALILVSHPIDTALAFMKVITSAFTNQAAVGGAAGFTVMQTMQFGISRGVFSHASGIAVAPFLHSANTDSPADGAYMAAVTPVVDTLIVCTLTGLVVISSGLYTKYTGGYLTAHCFYNALGPIGYFIVVTCLVIFAFTTIIGWFFYTEKCFAYLGGQHVRLFSYFFVGVTLVGPFFPVAFVWSLADVLCGALLFINLLSLTYLFAKSLFATRKELFV